MRQKAKGAPRGKPFVKGDARAGRPRGSENRSTVDVRKIAKGIVDDPTYRQSVQTRARSGELAPAVECLLWHYAYGKPKESVEMTGANGEPLMAPQPVLMVMGDAATSEDADAPEGEAADKGGAETE